MHTEIEFSSEVSAGCDRRFGPKNKGAGDSDAVLTPEGNRRSPDASSGEENCGESAEHCRELSAVVKCKRESRLSSRGNERHFRWAFKGPNVRRALPVHST